MLYSGFFVATEQSDEACQKDAWVLTPRLNVLVVEDDEVLREVVVESLRAQGHRTVGLDCAEALNDEAGGKPVDLLILDLNLPGEDGLSVARRFRAVHPRVGIIIMTGRVQARGSIQYYESGGDICLTKPVTPAELIAAVDAVAQRLDVGALHSRATDTDALRLDQRRLRLQAGRGETTVSDAECAMLVALARAPGQSLEVWQLLELLGQADDPHAKGNLEVRMVRLRARLREVGADPRALRSVRNWGYHLGLVLTVQ
jgi:DNA-binding response OmpR family regulator